MDSKTSQLARIVHPRFFGKTYAAKCEPHKQMESKAVHEGHQPTFPFCLPVYGARKRNGYHQADESTSQPDLPAPWLPGETPAALIPLAHKAGQLRVGPPFPKTVRMEALSTPVCAPSIRPVLSTNSIRVPTGRSCTARVAAPRMMLRWPTGLDERLKRVTKQAAVRHCVVPHKPYNSNLAAPQRIHPSFVLCYRN